MALVQLFIVLILHGIGPVDESSGDNGQQSAKAFRGFGMGPVDFVIKGLYGGAICNKARVKENAGIPLGKILFLYALVDLLVQLMLVHGRRCGWRRTAFPLSLARVRRGRPTIGEGIHLVDSADTGQEKSSGGVDALEQAVASGHQQAHSAQNAFLAAREVFQSSHNVTTRRPKGKAPQAIDCGENTRRGHEQNAGGRTFHA